MLKKISLFFIIVLTLGAIPTLHHDTLDGYLPNEHLDWTSNTGSTIDSNNIPSLDVSDKTNLTAGTGITLTDDTLSTNDSEIDHDATTNFVANEHIDWTNASDNLSTSGSVTGVNVTSGADPGHTHTAYILDAGTPADNTLLRFDGTDGITTQTSNVAISDADDVSGLNSATVTLNPDLVTNGTFTGSAAGWTLETTWTYGANVIDCVDNGDGNAYDAYQSISITAGVNYRVQFDITNFDDTDGAGFKCLLGGAEAVVITANGSYDEPTVAAGSSNTNITFRIESSDGGADEMTVDNVTVWKVRTTSAFGNGLREPSGTDASLIYSSPGDGDVFLDTDASANGTLLMYSNGAWRTVASW